MMFNPFDHKEEVEADKRQLCSKVSRPNIFHKNQHLKYQGFPKFPETSVEIFPFCSDFNARDITISERHLSAS